ncbi:MAG: malonate decarboxylase acyl carrier protein [Defluviitaleaceae bacterium]|nr:malonate decarboxylase acyl carrier protein [Defluviitaleaceae bacterium]
MALHNMTFTFPGGSAGSIPKPFSHTGVVGSGDLEALFTKADLKGGVEAQVTTPVRGYDAVWEKVLGRFVAESGLSDVKIHLNDNNATPFVVTLRLKQALAEAMERGEAS